MPTDRELVAAVVADLQAFLEALTRRPDLVVDRLDVYEPADPDDIDYLRETEHYPEQLLLFYELMDHVVVEWHFADNPDQGGCLDLSSISTKYLRQFLTDEENGYAGYELFGAGSVSLPFDWLTPENNTWLVAAADTPEARRAAAFVYQYDKTEQVPVAATLVEYLRRGMAAGFVLYWPEPHPHPSVQQAIDRFNAPAG